MVFALIYGTALVMIRLAFPGSTADRGSWQPTRLPLATIALHLVAYGGVAFLWFMGVVRTRVGRHEDRVLGTVFMGSGFLFPGMSFVAGAVTSAVLGTMGPAAGQPLDGSGFTLGSRIAFELVNVYAMRMAAVFMISLATLCLRTGAMPRSFVLATYALALALVLLLSIGFSLWATLVFPLWVRGFSLYLLWYGLGDADTPAPSLAP